MARSRGAKGAAKRVRKRRGFNAPETKKRLALWLAKDDSAAMERESAAIRVPELPPPATEIASLPAPSAAEIALRHLGRTWSMEGHEKASCRACAVVDAIFLLEAHERETPDWEAAAEFVRGIEAVIPALRRLADITDRADPAADYAAARIGRLARFTLAEFEARIAEHRTRFSSPDYRARNTTKPAKPLIKELTKSLCAAGFSVDEIAVLVDDGEEASADPKAARDRTRKRLE